MASLELASAALALVDQLNEGVVVAHLDGTITYANGAVTALLGWAPEELIGGPVLALIPERLRSAHQAGLTRYARTGVEHIIGDPIRVPALTKEGGERPVELVLSSLDLPGAGVVIAATLRDVSGRVDLERQTALAHHLLRVFLKDLDEDELLTEIVAALGRSLELAAVAFWRPDPEGTTLTCAHFWRSGAAGASLARASEGLRLRRGEGLPGRVWASGSPAWVHHLDRDSNYPRRRAAAEDGLSSAWAVPVQHRRRTVGVLELYPTAAQAPDEALLSLSGVVGLRMGQAIRATQVEQERRRLAEQEHAVVAAFRTSLLTVDLPRIDGLELAASFRPGSASVVGGDFYDAFPVDDDDGGQRWGFAIGDVCGTGPEAAAVTAHVRYATRALMRAGLDLEAIGHHLNDALLSRQDRRFCTAILGSLSVAGDEAVIRIVNAGHPCPVLRRADGTTSALPVGGALLGALPRVELSAVEVTLAPGDALVLHTDGVTEARREGELFGEERLMEVVAAGADGSAEDLATAILTATQDFAHQTLSDDLAVFVIRQTAPTTSPPGR